MRSTRAPTIPSSPSQANAIFRAFDVTITFDKAKQTLDLSATIASELLSEELLGDLNERDRTEARSRVSDIAGAGSIPKPATAHSPRTLVLAHRVEALCAL